jgi:serine/threonine-protein kinase
MTTAKPSRRGVPQPLHGGPQRFGPYLLEARLAVGATTEVYLARLSAEEVKARSEAGTLEGPDPLPERFVVKRLLPHLVSDAEGRTRFQREAALHSVVLHPNVVRVFASGTTAQGEPYLAMEYVDGCDAFRLLRRTTHERTVLPVTASVFVMREVLRALTAVHEARDAAGVPLGIVHRDVTPSNIYLSSRGDVKLGDFGIARSMQRIDARPAGEGAQDVSLMGKFSYLAPEQVAGEPFDHRADLFSAATVLAELLIGKPLFPGTGQLQVLLAIRDCNLKPLHDARDRLPEGVVPVLEKALSRDPALRFADAGALGAALAPFAGNPEIARSELAVRVRSVQTVPSDAHLAAVRESARAIRSAPRLDVIDVVPPEPTAPLPEPARAAAPATAAVPPAEDSRELEIDIDEQAFDDDDEDPHARDTGTYPELVSYVLRPNGQREGPFTFAKLVEAIATGGIAIGDKVDYLGAGWKPIQDIPDLLRLLPKTSTPPAPTPTENPAYAADLSVSTMLDVLAYVLMHKQSGLLLLEKPAEGDQEAQRREVYFLRGRLHHVPSTNAGERLGEFLVRRGKLAREELDLALAVLPRYGGRMGDTLIGLGLVDGVDIFRAIREQGQGRVTELFLWRDGFAYLHPETEVPAVEFPLDLDLPTLMLAGMEASHPGDTPMQFIEPQLDSMVVPNPRPELASFVWPPLVAATRDALTKPMTLRDLLGAVTRVAQVSGADVARALELLLAMDLAHWQ